jgi:hypothetical protein
LEGRSFSPHLPQKFVLSGLSKLHLGHFMNLKFLS